MAEENKKSKKSLKDRIPYFKYLLYFWSFLVVIFLGFVLFILGIVSGWFGELPSTQRLENPESNLASKVFSKDGKLLGKFFTQNRSNVKYENISEHMIHALIATEDARFYEHPGIDIQALFRVFFFRIILGQESAGGGSTITQQLAKNLFPRQDFDTWGDIIVRKTKEWVIAVRLERYYTKKEILRMYLNTVTFGSNTYGIQAAANTFYNKPPDSLKREEAAVLVGALKATHLYSPVYNPENSKARRNVVLYQMNKYEYFDDATYDSLTKLPIDLNYKVESHDRGDAMYFRAVLRQKMEKWCARHGYNLYTDGLRIHTTINSRMQKHAQRAVHERMEDLQADFFAHWEGHPPPWEEHKEIITNAIKRSDRYKRLKAQGLSRDSIMEVFNTPVKMKVFSYEGLKDTVMTPLDSIKYYKYFLHAGFMAMRPSSGEVKAWVGGVNFKHFKYDHVNKSAKRQVGSTFKPFVYSVAASTRGDGYSPCFKLPNTPVVFEDFDNWQPKNASGEYGGMVTLKDGLANSINCITARLIKRVGPQAVVQRAKEMGITSPIKPYPSIALGTMDISVYEMVSAFSTFANEGRWTEPIYLLRIEDKHGNILENFKNTNLSREVLNPPSNYIMVDMLKHVVNTGTSVRLRYRYDFRNPIIGKTGTTQNQSDGWFLGAVPDLAAGVWVGGANRSIHFRDLRLGQGANMALPIWAKFMKGCYEDNSVKVSKEEFPKPPGEIPVELDCEKYEQEGGGKIQF